jgi:hypothetical protein
MAVTLDELHSLLNTVRKMSEDELRRVITSVTERRAVLVNQNIRVLRPGMRVSWNGKFGPQTGVVQKVKTKWVEVIAEPIAKNLHWNVTASALTVIPDPNKKEIEL